MLEQAFAVLLKIMQHHRTRGIFKPSIAEFGLCMFQLGNMAHNLLPDLHLHFPPHCLGEYIYATILFLTLFTTTLWVLLVCRIMEILLFEGVEVVIKVFLALRTLGQDYLMLIGSNNTLKYVESDLPGKAEVGKGVCMSLAYTIKERRQATIAPVQSNVVLDIMAMPKKLLRAWKEIALRTQLLLSPTHIRNQEEELRQLREELDAVLQREQILLDSQREFLRKYGDPESKKKYVSLPATIGVAEGVRDTRAVAAARGTVVSENKEKDNPNAKNQSKWSMLVLGSRSMMPLGGARVRQNVHCYGIGKPSAVACSHGSHKHTGNENPNRNQSKDKAPQGVAHGTRGARCRTEAAQPQLK